MKTKKPKSGKQNFIAKIYDSTHKWESDLWILKWIALLFIIVDFHWINTTPISKIVTIILTEVLYFIYALLYTAYFRKKLSFNVQFLNLLFDFLWFTFFLYLSLSMFSSSSRIYVLYIIPVIYCSYWFKWAFTLIFVTLVSAAYFIINYSILLANKEEFFIISEIKGTLGPVVAVYFLITFLVIFFKRIILKYLVDIDRELEDRAEKLKQEKEYTRSLLKDKIDGFIAIDEDGYVTEVNKLACELFGYDESEIYSKNVKEIYAHGEAARMIRALRESSDGTIENFRTFVVNNKDGEKIPIMVSAAFLYDRKNLDLKEELAKGKRFPNLGYFRDLRAEEVFDRIGKEIIFLQNEKALLTEIAGSISRILKAEACSILIYNGVTNRLEINTSYGIPRILRGFKKPIQEQYDEMEGLVGYVFSTGKTLNVKRIDISNKKIYTADNVLNYINFKWNYVENFAEYSKYKDFQHFLAAPLKIEGEVYGVIRVLNKYLNDKELDKNGFHDEDQSQLERISNQVSIIVEKFMNKERFESISKIGMELNERLDLPLDDFFLGFVASKTVYRMQFTACFIYIVEEGNKLRIKAYEGLEGDYAENEKYTLKIGEGISGEVAKTGIHRMISDIKKEETKFNDIYILEEENLKSMLSVPINYENKVFGVINCCTRRAHIFTQEEIQIIQTFAIYTAVAIQNRKRVRELLAINEIGSELVKPFQLEKLFDHILEKAMDISGADRICIKKYDERTGDISTLSSWGCEWHNQTKEYVLKLGDDFISEVIRNRQPKIIPQYDIKLEKLGKVPNRKLFADTKSCMIVPIKIYGRVFGALCLESRQDNFFDENDILILRTFSNQAAAAIRNADFFNKLQNVKQTFLKISKLSIDIHKVLEKIVNIAAEVLETDVLILYRYDDKTGKIIPPPTYTGEIRYKEFIESEALDAEIPLLIIKKENSHYADHSQYDQIMTAQKKVLKDGSSLFVIREEIVSSAGIILKVWQEIVGVMFINYRTPHEFNADERQLIEIFASYIAIAIQNVKHFRETKIALTMQTVGQIASNFAHKLKNDIGTLNLYTGHLMDETKPGQPQYFPLSQIKEKISKITAEIDHLQKASKLFIQEKRLTNINDLIDDLKSEISQDLKTKKIKLDVKIPANIPEIEIDPVQIKLVLWNLARNSVEAMPEGGKISISIFKSQENILIECADSGTGIPLENSSKIFDVFWTTKNKGYGLGLFHARSIIEEHNGSISLDINYKEGARFLIELPLK
jgi:PAS domain S-box-containing protein